MKSLLIADDASTAGTPNAFGRELRHIGTLSPA
jgi:hypothetical protein